MMIAAALLVLATAQPAANAIFQPTTAKGVLPASAIQRLDPKHGLLLEGQEQGIPFTDLVSWNQLHRNRPMFPRGSQVILANGDRISGQYAGGTETLLSWKCKLGTDQEFTLQIPLTTISAIWFGTLPADLTPEPTQYPWYDQLKKRDTILLKNGDTWSGLLEGFANSSEVLRIKQNNAESRLIAVSQIRAVVCDPSLARVRLPAGLFLQLVLADGSRLSTQIGTGDKLSLSTTTLFGTKLQIPWQAINTVAVLNGPSVNLSRVKFQSRSKPFLSLDWPPEVDKSLKRGWLTLESTQGSNCYEHGIATTGDTELIFQLTQPYRRLIGKVGLAPGQPLGQVSVEVQVDRLPASLGSSAALMQGQDPLVIDIPLTNAKELRLKTRALQSGIQSEVHWVDMKLVR